jgi:thiamine biosynthesis lipoprotein
MSRTSQKALRERSEKVDKRIFAVTAACIFMGGCSGGNGYFDEPVSKSDFLMDTYMTVTVYNGSSSAPEKALSRAGELEKKWSVTDSSSEIYAADHSGGKPVTLSEDTADLVSFALSMNEKTDGALDISLYPVLCEWGFTTGEYRVPEEEEIRKTLSLVDQEAVVLETEGEETWAVLDRDQGMDLGAVAKGETSARIMEIFREHGVTSAMVSLGGNIQCLGTKPDGSLWRVAITDPNNTSSTVGTVDVGEMVMKRLKDIDEVAYVRFASVYRSFKDINTFMEELSKLLLDKK